MKNSEWTARIATADRYIDAQYVLMMAATSGSSLEDTIARLDEVRRCRVAFLAIPPPAFVESGLFSPAEAQEAVIFLEKNLKARKNDKLLMDWLAGAELPSSIALFEKTCGLDCDPDNDIFFLGGSIADDLQKNLERRAYSRIIKVSELSNDGGAAEIDPVKLSEILERLPNVRAVRPERAHYIDPEATDDVTCARTEQIQSRVKLLYVSRNTSVLMAPLWTTQLIKNLPKLVAEGKNALALKDSLAGQVAVVIGAGPSLDSILAQLEPLQNRLIIICAFKALKAVCKAGIRPDFVVCLDPKQKTRHLEGVELSQIGAFVVEAASNDEMVQSINGCPVVPFVASDLPIELLRTINVIDIPIIGTAGSAVHGAIQIATLVGCKSIYLAGTDFGFPENRLYANEAGSGDKFTVSSDGRSYKRQPLDSHFREGELRSVLSNDGGFIGASLEMVKFREWVEQRIEQLRNTSGTTFYNLCPNGAQIIGAPFVSSIPMIDLPDSTKPSVREIADSLPFVRKVTPSRLRELLFRRMEKLRALRSSCDKILEKSQKERPWIKDVCRMQTISRKAVEVSLIINDKLIELDEYTDRVKSINPAERSSLLIKLVQTTRDASQELIDLYKGLTAVKS